MATTTTKMALRKPATSDVVNVTTDISDSMQKIDDTLPTTTCTSGARPGTPFTGQLIFETDTKVFRIWDGTVWRKALLGDATTDANSNAPADPTAFRNVIRNGGMDIWQRGAGPFTTPDYTADGWLFSEGSGATCQIDRLAIANGAIPGRGDFALQWARSVAGTTVSSVAQRIEDVATFAGETVTISFEAWTASGSVDFQVRLDQYFGTGGSPSTTVSGTLSGVLTATTTVAQKLTFTTTLASISGKTKGTDSNDYLLLSIFRQHNATNGATGTVYIRNVQVERGSVATPFEIEPYNTVLSRCQRYFYRLLFTTSSVCGPAAVIFSATDVYCTYPLPTPMRNAISNATTNVVGSFGSRTGGTMTANAHSPYPSGQTLDNNGNVTSCPVRYVASAGLAATTAVTNLYGSGCYVDFNAEL